MIIKLTLVGLVLVLIGVIVMSYYVNKEGFDDISNGYMNSLSNEFSSAVNTISTDTSSAVNAITGDSNTATQGVNDSVPAVNSTTPMRNDIVPEVSVSGSGYNAMTLQQRAELLKDIQKVVRNEVLASRATKPIIPGETRQEPSESTAQGQEYEGSCYKDTDYRCPKNPDGSCPPVPDMSEYIKKDSIPCWGCALDY